MTLIPTTRATPTISAPPVRAVRLGLRRAFSRASSPVIPEIAGSGLLIGPAIGRVSSGPSTNTPTNTPSAPRPTQMIPAPDRPTTKPRMPSPVTSPPNANRCQVCPVRSRATSRSAAIGGIREARRAGNTAEPTVTAMPTTSETIAVRARNTVPPAGMSIPSFASIAFSRPATPTPRNSPTIEATSPTTTASMSCAPST